MKTLNIAVTSLLLIAGEAFAASTVSDVVARQRWPWNGKVDIDYTVTGDKTDVDFYATWDGQATPVLIGTDFQIEAGQHRFEFDPSLSGFAGKTTTGFAVTASAAGADAHKYLVVDLVNGGYSYLSAPPTGGWTEEHKTTKMVFARIPAGTYVNGLTVAQRERFGITYSTAAGSAYRFLANRTVTLTSDFYMGIYKMTTAQYNVLKTGADTTGTTAAKFVSYNEIRGKVDGPNEIDWPITKYKVDEGTLARKLRDLTKGLTVDLPAEEQWEAAARCGKSTYWSNGGDADDDYSTLSNYLNQVAMWAGSGYTSKSMLTTVGVMAPNDNGLYDTTGIGGEWTLDCARYQKDDRTTVLYTGLSNSEDPVGASNPTHAANFANRVIRSGGSVAEKTPLEQMTPAYRMLMYPSADGNTYARFCIHLKPLKFAE